MVETRQDLVSEISEETRTEMLERNWLSHDARWQMAVVESLGWDVGNQLNQKVARDEGKTIMLRCMKVLGISRVVNIQEFRDVMAAIRDLNWSKVMKLNLKCLSETSILFEITNCITYNNIVKANATDKYECGCFALRSGFCDALKLEVSQECKKCLMKGDDKCEIVLTMKNWRK